MTDGFEPYERLEYEPTIKARLLTQFRNAPAMNAFIGAVAELLADFEQTCYDMEVFNGSSPRSATGDTLDRWLSVFGIDGRGLDSEEARRILLARFIVDQGLYNPDRVALAYTRLTGTSRDVQYSEYAPLYYEVTAEVEEIPSVAMREAIRRNMNSGKPAGVGADYIIGAPVGGVFTLDIGPGLDEGELAGYV